MITKGARNSNPITTLPAREARRINRTRVLLLSYLKHARYGVTHELLCYVENPIVRAIERCVC
jgi:hypothetical protein